MVEKLWNDVKDRLYSLGYVVTPDDEFVMGFLIDKVVMDIRTCCNVKRVPDKLYYVAVDLVTGEFLQMKKGKAGDIEDNLPGFDIDGAVKQIKAGDTTIDMALGSGEMTAEQRLDAYIQHLLSSRKSLVKVRRLSW